MDLSLLLATEPAVGEVLVADHDGDHSRCPGWTYDRRDGLLACECGAVLYECTEVDRG